MTTWGYLDNMKEEPWVVWFNKNESLGHLGGPKGLFFFLNVLKEI